MAFSPTFLLRQQEGYLIQACLTSGMTHLRNARVDTKGSFYAAFFQLSIGLERLMKTTLIIDHMSKHDFAAPTIKELRAFGHNLASLFEELRDLDMPNAD